MTDVSPEQLQAAIAAYVDPYLGQDLVSAKAVRDIRADAGVARVTIELGFPALGYHDRLRSELRQRLLAVPGITAVDIAISTQVAVHAVQKNLKPIDGVKNVIAVASGKGGVGKSTTAVNLALALRAEGASVGLLDADIYGPSQPRMLGLSGQRPTSTDNKTFEPLVAYGLQCMSVGFLVNEEEPMVWRGPMATQAFNQLMGSTRWKGLDYLIVDMPPGTGDIQLTLSQQVPVSGAIIVTTPQDIALLDARKGLRMFEKVGVSILGIVENMSTHICEKCGHEQPIFGEGGGARMAAQSNVPLLGSLPLDIRIRQEADGGFPTVAADPDGPIGQAYREIARRAVAKLAAAAKDYSRLFPKITIEDS
ncbi:MAG: iron-sulfur cluster carrier protein ApbC [Gammaproteobacteria bacterium]|nr:iron-sulfur cluster carrier protein ApbC [Gammaproteobacteria bacterium]